jgi:hypothetical protein
MTMSSIVPTLVYLLCFLTSLICALLLGRSYVRTRTRMLLWSAACFTLLAITNLLVVFDLLVFDHIDLRPARLWLSLAAVGVLLFGFIWDQDD